MSSPTWGDPLWGDSAFADPGTGASSTGGGTGGSGAVVGPHLYWRLYITNADVGFGQFSVGVAEWKSYDSSGTLLSTIGGTATASSVFGTGREADKAFDANDGTSWTASGDPRTSPEWLAYQFASPVEIDHFTITQNSGLGPSPATFSLQYSDDGAAWTPVYSYQNLIVGNASGATLSETLYTTGVVWRVSVTATDAGLSQVVISNLKFYDTGGVLLSTATGSVLASTWDGGSPPANGFGGSCSGWWSSGYPLSTQTPQWLAFQFLSPVTVGSFSFQSPGNPALVSRTAHAFSLQKSTDGSTWATVASFTAATWTTTCQTQTFSTGLTGGGTASIAIIPAQGFDGSTYSITVAGTGTSFVDGVTAVTISGGGATISNVVVASATSLTFTLELAPNAVIGARTVTTATGAEAPTATFTILPLVVTGRKRGDIGWSQIREGLDGIWGFGPYGVATDGSFLAGDIPVVGPDGATLIGSGQGIAFLGGGGGPITVNGTATVQINGTATSFDNTVLVNGA